MHDKTAYLAFVVSRYRTANTFQQYSGAQEKASHQRERDGYSSIAVRSRDANERLKIWLLKKPKARVKEKSEEEEST